MFQVFLLLYFYAIILSEKRVMGTSIVFQLCLQMWNLVVSQGNLDLFYGKVLAALAAGLR